MMSRTTPCPDAVLLDRISGLPDCLLCHILSFLPTKQSVATSVLSTRWRYLYASIPDINLEFNPTYWPELDKTVLQSLDSRRLLDFVCLGSRILQLRDSAPIRKFRLSLNWIDQRFRLAIESFVSAALCFNVQELEIYVATQTPLYVLTCPLIFACQTLVYLQLFVDLDVPKSVFLPNLKVLQMSLMGLADDSVQRLIRGCPVLEELTLDIKCLEDEDKDIEVVIVDFSSPSIKRLAVRFWGGECIILVESNTLESLEYFVSRHDGEHQVFINARNLKYLSYFAPAVGASFNQNLNSLVGARIGVGWRDDHLTTHDALDHLVRVQRVKSLSLGEHMLEVLYGSPDFLPTFENLTSLELLPDGHSGEINHVLSWTMLRRIFERAPNIEVLIFNGVVLDNIGENEELDDFFLEVLPICFVKNLKEIEIKYFNKKEYEFKLVEYLLENGIALKKMVVGQFLVPSVCRRLLSLKRLSTDCQIVLDELKTYFSSISDDL